MRQQSNDFMQLILIYTPHPATSNFGNIWKKNLWRKIPLQTVRHVITSTRFVKTPFLKLVSFGSFLRQYLCQGYCRKKTFRFYLGWSSSLPRHAGSTLASNKEKRKRERTWPISLFENLEARIRGGCCVVSTEINTARIKLWWNLWRRLNLLFGTGELETVTRKQQIKKL